MIVVVMLCDNNSKALKQMEAFCDAPTSLTNTVLLAPDNVMSLAGFLLQYQLQVFEYICTQVNFTNRATDAL